MVGHSGRLLGVGLAVVLASCAGTPSADLPADVSTITAIATAMPTTVSNHFDNPADAATAAARAENPDLVDPRLTRMVGVYADATTVDLRVQIQAEGFCHWYGVSGHVQGGALQWSAQPASPCTE
ncbi:MAG: hypothetical protein WEA29_03945 [Acidimicrobiia bacterium]